MHVLFSQCQPLARLVPGIHYIAPTLSHIEEEGMRRLIHTLAKLPISLDSPPRPIVLISVCLRDTWHLYLLLSFGCLSVPVHMSVLYVEGICV